MKFVAYGAEYLYLQTLGSDVGLVRIVGIRLTGPDTLRGSVFYFRSDDVHFVLAESDCTDVDKRVEEVLNEARTDG